MLDWLGKDPSEAFAHFQGPWGKSQEFAGYIGAIWVALLWRSPSALQATGLDNSNRLRKLGEQLVAWGTVFQERGFKIDCCKHGIERTPGLALCDELWRVKEGWEIDPDPELQSELFGVEKVGNCQSCNNIWLAFWLCAGNRNNILAPLFFGRKCRQ